MYSISDFRLPCQHKHAFARPALAADFQIRRQRWQRLGFNIDRSLISQAVFQSLKEFRPFFPAERRVKKHDIKFQAALLQKRQRILPDYPQAILQAELLRLTLQCGSRLRMDFA